MDNSEIKKKLSSINWNFDFTIDYAKDTLHPFNCRKYYSYPATFIPEIPYALIEILSQKGDVVLDPFGGIGTTFIQALSLERVPYSFDINPVASNVCKTLYKLLDPSINKEELREQLIILCSDFDKSYDYTTTLSEHRKELADWFENNTFNEISYLFMKRDNLRDQLTKDVMTLILSSILVTLSSQNKGWAYIADNVKPKPDELRKKQVFEQYIGSTNILLNDIISHESHLSKTYANFYSMISPQSRVFNNSILNTSLHPQSVDLVVTSPPYPRMIDYVKSQRLSFAFLDNNYLDYRGKEIGARYRRSRRDFLEKYEMEIDLVNKKTVELLKTNAYCCVVLPDFKTDDSRKQSIDRILKNYNSLGLNKVFEICRYIPSHKRTLSIQWATLINERMYVFQKE